MVRSSSRIPIKKDSHLFSGIGAIATLSFIVIAGAWPIYEKTTIFLAGFGALVAGILLGLAFAIRQPKWYRAVFYTYLVYVGSALLTAVPWVYSVFSFSLLQGLRHVLLGPAVSWKSLLTISIPVGNFEDTQLPLFITVYLAALLATFLLANPRYNWAFALIPLGVALLFPTIFGAADSDQILRLGPLVIPMPIHQIGGIIGFAVLLGWAIIRTRRKHNARLSTVTRGKKTHAQRELGTRLRKGLTAYAMVAVSIILASLLAMPANNMRDRFVARDVVENKVEFPELSNPLSAYRANYTSEFLTTPLISFEGDVPQYVRFASLPVYDNIAFRAANAENTGALTHFERVPYRVSSTTGTLHSTHVTIQKYASSWLPIASEFSQVSFEGKTQQNLTSSFYFNQYSQAAIVNIKRSADIGIREGDSYTLVYADTDILSEDTKNTSAKQPNASGNVIRPDEDDFSHMYRWLDEQGAGSASVGEVIRLRDAMLERSYLGRSKAEPEGKMTWLPDNYIFRSSDSGQTLERMENIFEAMTDPKYQKCSTPTDKCAAHVGDEEQYAAATALIARALGFPSRIVYGAVVPENGVVTGKDTSVWTEIQTSDGAWVHLNINIREDNAFIEQPNTESYRQYNPGTNQENAPIVTPPDKEPSTSGQKKTHDDEEKNISLILRYVVPTAKSVGATALLTSPLWGILLYKALRRRKRSRHPDPNQRLLGAWQEYIDRLVDSGESVQNHQTRREIATVHNKTVQLMAIDADYVAFSGLKVSKTDADNYWKRAMQERQKVLDEKNFWQKLRTRLSTNSLGRYRKKKNTDGHFRLNREERK